MLVGKQSFIPLLRKISLSPSQGVQLFSCFLRRICYPEVKTGKEFRPLGLLTVQQFCAHEVFQVLMIAQNLDWMVRTLQVRPPFLKSPDDCHEFLIIDFIIAFCRAVFLGVKGDQM